MASEDPFPRGFEWGAATASYQIEGAVHEDGRGESIWDRFSHLPGRTVGGDTGDVACDHYHRYREDVALMARLGLGAYRFSVAWSRVLPTGAGAVNAAGLDFYDRLVDELCRAGIAPHVTLYHWDLPQALEDAGGWPVRGTAEAFAGYADVVARRLGDRAASIATLNEPWCSAYLGYRVGTHAPGRTEPAAANAAAHHLLVAHGLAMSAIRAAAPGTPAGIVLNFEPKRPASTHPLDLEAAGVEHDQYNRWFLDPITGRGYPADGVRAWGWGGEEVRAGDMELVAAPIDFLGVNYYTCRTVRSPLLTGPLPSAPEPERTSTGWEVHPEGLTEVLEYVHSRTGELPLYVTENGAAYDDDPADRTRDPERTSYLRRHVSAAGTAIERGVPLRGYFAWSLLDNFEWSEGYAHRFGLVDVDFETQERRVRDSGRYWSSLASAGRAVRS
ncbi:MAG: GH1 family beta-glucosidase [Candidatus Limnocylindrales bacterium]